MYLVGFGAHIRGFASIESVFLFSRAFESSLASKGEKQTLWVLLSISSADGPMRGRETVHFVECISKLLAL